MRAAAVRFLNDRLDWNLLRTFLVIMQERSVSRAAARPRGCTSRSRP